MKRTFNSRIFWFVSLHIFVQNDFNIGRLSKERIYYSLPSDLLLGCPSPPPDAASSPEKYMQNFLSKTFTTSLYSGSCGSTLGS